MTILDSSVLIRFFTNDDKKKARVAAELLQSSEELFIPDVVFTEIEFVLKRLYGASKKEITKAFIFLVSKENIKTNPEIKRAVGRFEKSNLSFADCLVLDAARSNKLVSFDEELLKAHSLKSQ